MVSVLYSISQNEEAFRCVLKIASIFLWSKLIKSIIKKYQKQTRYIETKLFNVWLV